MKTKQKLVFLIILAALIQPFVFKAQCMSFRQSEEPSGEKKTGWQQAKLDDKGTYVKEGIEFYSKKAECAPNKVTLLKLVNTNNYPVKVSYQLNPDSSIVNVMVGAAATIEGSCMVTNGNLGKLILNIPIGLSDAEKQKNKDFMRSHIIVSLIK